jgi:hypothetical protein
LTKYGAPPIQRGLGRDLRKLGYTAVFVVGFREGPVRLGTTSDPCDAIRKLQDGNPRPIQTFLVLWTAGRPLAGQIRGAAEDLLLKANRQLDTGWHDIPADLARQSVLIAAKKLNIRTFTHAEMMERCRQVVRERTQRMVDSLGGSIKGLTFGPEKSKFRSHSPGASADAGEYAPIDNVSPYIHDDPRREKPGSGRRKARRQKSREKPKRDHPFR